MCVCEFFLIDGIAERNYYFKKCQKTLDDHNIEFFHFKKNGICLKSNKS